MRYLFIILLFFSTHAFAQEGLPVVTAGFDRDSVMLGDQFHLEVRVTKDMMQVVDFPAFEGEIAPGVELIASLPVDTLQTDGRRHTIGKKYRVTIWEPGNYTLAPFPALYADKNLVDTLRSADSLRIGVRTFAIDLAKDKPMDIKPPMKVPLKIGEISGWVALTLGILAILAVAVWLFLKYRKRIPLLGGTRPELPPHVEAIRRLEALRNQKLPQNGRHKQYFSGLTDILRSYIERRWGIGAMEMTSAQIIDAIAVPKSAGEVDAKRYEDLSELLQVSDFVKFAKFVPDDDAVDRAYYNAYYFVEETKSVVEGRAEESEKEI